MLSKMAKADLDALRASGCHPTDEDVVRLNDLAIRIERGKETTPVNAPRVAKAGNVVLHEPTIGSIRWWMDYGMDSAGSTDAKMMTYYFTLANALNLDYLVKLTEQKKIRKAVKDWSRHVDATEDELWRAFCWCKYGTGNVDDNPAKDEIRSSIEDEDVMRQLWMQVIAASGALHLTPDDLMTVTQSEMIGLTIQASIISGKPMSSSVARDYIAYRQVIKEIEDRDLTDGGQ